MRAEEIVSGILERAGILPGDLVLVRKTGEADALLMQKIEEADAIGIYYTPDNADAMGKYHVRGTIEEMSAAVNEISKGKGANVVIDINGCEEFLGWAIGALSQAGTLVFNAKKSGNIVYNAADIVRKELNVLSVDI